MSRLLRRKGRQGVFGLDVFVACYRSGFEVLVPPPPVELKRLLPMGAWNLARS